MQNRSRNSETCFCVCQKRNAFRFTPKRAHLDLRCVTFRFGDYISFVKILGQREGQPIKPDPAIVGQIMAEVPELGREDVVYVGDSNVDMQTGANAGVRTIGVTWGFRSRKELEDCNPSAVVDTVEVLTAEILR